MKARACRIFFYLFKEFNGILHCFHLLKYVYMYIFFKAIFPCILYFTSRYMYVLWFHKVLKICYIETISIHFHRSQVHTPYNKPGISWKICKNILYHTSLFIYRVLSKYPKKVNVDFSVQKFLLVGTRDCLISESARTPSRKVVQERLVENKIIQ